MDASYDITGFQSPCAEFAQKPLSLDERFLVQAPSVFIVQAAADSPSLGIKRNDLLIIDRSLSPKEGQLVLLVIHNNFQLSIFSFKKLMGQDPEAGDFLWGVVTASIREYVR